MAFQTSQMVVLMVLCVALFVESSRTRSSYVRASDPQSLGPTQLANSASFVLIQRTINQIRAKCRGTWRGIDIVGFRKLESNGTVFIVKLYLRSAFEMSSRYVHAKIYEPREAKIRVVRAEPAKHLWSQLGPCNNKAFSVEIPFDDDKRSLRWWIFDSIQGKLRENYPKLFQASELELMSHKNGTNLKRERVWLFRIRISPRHKGAWDRPRHAHLTVVEPDAKLLTVEDIQTGVNEFTPIEYFSSFRAQQLSERLEDENRCDSEPLDEVPKEESPVMVRLDQ